MLEAAEYVDEAGVVEERVMELLEKCGWRLSPSVQSDLE